MSTLQFTDATDPASLSRYDWIIDVRSPSEFAEDRLPGAVNLPVLSDAERAEVGTIYVQESTFTARKVGAAYVARNIAAHLETTLAGLPKGFAPLVYCWRGGQRSNAMAAILSQVGWRTTVLSGGYRTYRRRVKQRLYDDPCGLDLVLLDGGTGSGKTRMLELLAERGVQVLDLEGLAAHRGSLFGGLPGQPQPGQKQFESRLLAAIEALDPARPVVAEAESSKIGDRIVPPSLWTVMAGAPRIELEVPRAERAAFAAAVYADIARDRAQLEAAFARLPAYPGRKRLEDWRGLADAGAFAELAEALMETHYDPAYARSSRRDERPRLGVVPIERLDAERQGAAADEIVRLIEGRR
jgi:tRNA 2-selenouridine synthase